MGGIARFLDQIVTAWRLGPANVARVLLYRLMLRIGCFRRSTPVGDGYDDPLFRMEGFASPAGHVGDDKESDLAAADRLMAGKFTFFSHRQFDLGSPPDWFGNPYVGGSVMEPNRHWSLIGDFSGNAGDIKCVWEISRFDWALTLAQAYRATGDERYLQRLIAWSSDWTARNPANVGPNWKCGQETSIRMLQVLLTAHILGEDKDPLPALVRFVEEHCARIQPTYFYARGQDNNHGTSEAAALFIGGAWLQSVGGGRRGTARWNRLGRRWLEERIARLVEPDGTFAQYSVNYHRMLIDTLCAVEFWRRKFDLPEFSDGFTERAKAALDWLRHLTDATSGGAPNMGSNDGVRLFNLTTCAYGDFRPTLQLGYALFHDQRLFGPGPWDQLSKWLDVGLGGQVSDGRAVKSRLFGDGGFVVLRPENEKLSFAVLRAPNYRFRPSQADALHLDLWAGGVNLLRDSGTYSYNAPAPWQTHFAGTAAHNTLEFDGRDQMPRLSRFLFGSWLARRDIAEVEQEDGVCRWQGGYRDRWRVHHLRTVSTDGRDWTVTDTFLGFKDKAILRWHLAPGDWRLDGDACVSDMASIGITSEPAPRRMELVQGWESRHYQDKTEVPVLEIEFAPGEIVATTKIRLRGE